jgi:hypothetical protein
MSSLNSQKDSGRGQGTAAAPGRQVGNFQEGSIGPKPTGYGLPCAHCKTYYAADLPACPVCKGKQRVSATEPLTTVAPAEQLPDPKQLEEERERFLRDFNSQVVAAATSCQSCYDELQERVDVLEAAMHMDIREAAQIVYDAVWADTSDPSKTYQNAAQALLVELRRRSAITQVFGQLRPPIN